MSQPPSGQLPPWERPQWQYRGEPPAAPQPAGWQPGPPPYGAPPAEPGFTQAGYYGQPPYGGAPYGQPPYGQPPYGQAPYAPLPYGAPAPRRSRKALWWTGGVVALLAVLVLGAVLADRWATPDSTEPAPAATWEPVGLGNDPVMDGLAVQCHDGSMSACDALFTSSDLDSEYEEYGDTCAGRRDAGAWPMCTDVFSDEAQSD